MSAIASNLASFFQMHNMFAQACISGYTPEIWAHQPEKGGNHPAWILTHITGVRRSIARNLGAEVAEDPWEKQVQFGSECLPADQYPELESISGEFLRHGQDISERLGSASEDALTANFEPNFPDGRERTLQEALMFLIAHEALHLGQMSYHRRLHDLPGIAQIILAQMSATDSLRTRPAR